MKDNELIEVLECKEFYSKEDICGDCKWKNKSFLCDKNFMNGMELNYFHVYGIKIYVYQFTSNNLNGIIDKIHSKELYHHRNGGYFALQCTNFHCGDACDCNCDIFRCNKFEKVPSRKQPHCIKFFNLNLPEKYSKNNIAFILGNLEFEKINK